MDKKILCKIKHLEILCDVNVFLFDVGLKCYQSADNLFCKNCAECESEKTHLYGCYEAERWDNKYIYYCPRGHIFVAVTLERDIDNSPYGIICGPIAMGHPEDLNLQNNIPLMSTQKVNSLCEIMKIIFCSTNFQSNILQNTTTEEFLNELYKIIDSSEKSVSHKYPIGLEKELQLAIKSGNAALSKELLNKLLGHIFFSADSNFEIIKSRVVELYVLLSRSAIEGGADVDRIFSQNKNYITEINSFTSIDKLAVWLSNIINRFIGYMFEFNTVKHIDTIFKVTGYIKENYMKKISLDDIANHVYLSRSYLSKIFKDEMNCSIVDYINKLRIEKSKLLLSDSRLTLVDIAHLIGFDDQSYFSKVFKNITGITPGKFKEKSINL